MRRGMGWSGPAFWLEGCGSAMTLPKTNSKITPLKNRPGYPQKERKVVYSKHQFSGAFAELLVPEKSVRLYTACTSFFICVRTQEPMCTTISPQIPGSHIQPSAR